MARRFLHAAHVLLGVVVLGLSPVRAEQPFIRGDADGSSSIDLTDAVVILNELFLGAATIECDDAADSNDDGSINISDPVATLGFLFLGAGPLPAPFPEPGEDPTADDLACGACAEGIFCAVVDDVVLGDFSASRSATPSLAIGADLRPRVLFPDDGGEMPHFVRRANLVWERSPIADSEGSIIRAATGDLIVHPETGASFALLERDGRPELWTEGRPSSWSVAHFFADARPGRRNILEVGEDGVLYAALELSVPNTRPPQPAIASNAGGRWTTIAVGEPRFVEGMTLVPSRAGQRDPYLAYWFGGQNGWEAWLGDSSGDAHRVELLGARTLFQEDFINGVVLESGGAPAAELLLPRWEGVEEQTSIAVVRGAVGGEAFDVDTLALGDPFFQAPEFCFEAPPIDGATCEVDFTRFFSLGVVVTQAGDVLHVYSRFRVLGVRVARCQGPDPRACTLEDLLEFSGDVRVAWLEGGRMREQIIVGDLATRRGSVAIDADDNLHLVCNDESRLPLDPPGSTVRFVQLAPR